MSVGLGWTPVGLTVTLSPGVKYKPAGFELRDDDGVAMNWPVGTSARLVLSDPTTQTVLATWTAVVAGANLSFDQSVVTAAAIPEGSHAQLYLTYGTQAEILWLSGGVVRRA